MIFLYTLILISVFLCLIRLRKGPTALDRVLAFDLLSVIMTGAMLLFAVENDAALLFAVAWIPAALGFVSTLVFCHFYYKGTTT